MHAKVATGGPAEPGFPDHVTTTRMFLRPEAPLIAGFFFCEVCDRADALDLEQRLDEGRRWNGEGKPPVWGGDAIHVTFERGKARFSDACDPDEPSVEISIDAFEQLFDLWMRGYTTKQTVEAEIAE
jgi:hypothetical protein